MYICPGKNKNRRVYWIYAILAGMATNLAYGTNALQLELVPTSKISTYDLWSTHSPQQAESGAVVAAYWPYDSESGHYLGNRKICGVLLLGSPDLGSKPSGFEVRSANCGYVLGGLKSVTPEFYLRDSKGAQEIIKISADGKISLRGKSLGRIEFN